MIIWFAGISMLEFAPDLTAQRNSRGQIRFKYRRLSPFVDCTCLRRSWTSHRECVSRHRECVPTARDGVSNPTRKVSQSALTFAFSSPRVGSAFSELGQMTLTKRQKEVLDFLVTFHNKHGYSPSFEEIARSLKLTSLATVHKHITTLERKGFVRRGYNQSRSIEVTQLPKQVREQGARAERGGVADDGTDCRGASAGSRRGKRDSFAGRICAIGQDVRAASKRKLDDR